jgi:hypothetical protein
MGFLTASLKQLSNANFNSERHNNLLLAELHDVWLSCMIMLTGGGSDHLELSDGTDGPTILSPGLCANCIR